MRILCGDLGMVLIHPLCFLDNRDVDNDLGCSKSVILILNFGAGGIGFMSILLFRTGSNDLGCSRGVILILIFGAGGDNLVEDSPVDSRVGRCLTGGIANDGGGLSFALSAAAFKLLTFVNDERSRPVSVESDVSLFAVTGRLGDTIPLAESVGWWVLPVCGALVPGDPTLAPIPYASLMLAAMRTIKVSEPVLCVELKL